MRSFDCCLRMSKAPCCTCVNAMKSLRLLAKIGGVRSEELHLFAPMRNRHRS